MNSLDRKKSFTCLMVLLALLSTIPLIWPGDAPWINDEPRLIQMALEHKQNGTLATHGLMGSRGVDYGPFPTWIYTALLYVTHDLIHLVAIRAAVVTVLTALSILWLARLCTALRPAAGALALLSPYLWIYSRQLWDNTFLIPISALTIAAYISFSVRPAVWKLWSIVFGLTSMALTHAMSIAVIIPVATLMLVFNRRWFYEHVLHAALAIFGSVIVCTPYIIHLATTPQKSILLPMFSSWEGWIFPFLGGRMFSAWGIEYFFDELWYSSPTLGNLEWIFFVGVLTWVILPMLWIGIFLGAKRVWTVLTSGGDKNADFHMGILCLFVMVAQCALNGMSRAYGHPHYYNAVWFCLFYFVWLAFSFLKRIRPLLALHSLSSAIVLIYLILSIHFMGGNRNIHYGSTLSNQISIVRKLRSYPSDVQVYNQVATIQWFPHALSVLNQFDESDRTPKTVAPSSISSVKSVLIHHPIFDDRTGWLVLDEIQE